MFLTKSGWQSKGHFSTGYLAKTPVWEWTFLGPLRAGGWGRVKGGGDNLIFFCMNPCFNFQGKNKKHWICVECSWLLAHCWLLYLHCVKVLFHFFAKASHRFCPFLSISVLQSPVWLKMYSNQLSIEKLENEASGLRKGIKSCMERHSWLLPVQHLFQFGGNW